MLNARVAAPYTFFRFTAEQYESLAESGIFTGQRVELIDGLIVRVAAMGTPHKWTVALLNRILAAQIDDPWIVCVQSPLRLSATSMPEPDLSIVRLPDDSDDDVYASASALVIEVSDSTRGIDLGPKAQLYAAAGVPEYWVLDLQKEQLVVHREPKRGSYTALSRHGKTKTVTSLREPRVTVKVGDVLR